MSLKPTIEDIRSLGHHQTTYDWGIQFINIPQMLSGFTSADLNTRCTTADIPSRSMDEIPIQLRGHKVFQHGIVSYKNKLNMTLYETMDSKVQDFLAAYMNMQWTPITGTQVPKSLNQCSFLLTLLDSEHNPTYYYTIIGAWLQDFSPAGGLQSTSSDVLTWNCTWTFDYFIAGTKNAQA